MAKLVYEQELQDALKDQPGQWWIGRWAECQVKGEPLSIAYLPGENPSSPWQLWAALALRNPQESWHKSAAEAKREADKIIGRGQAGC